MRTMFYCYLEIRRSFQPVFLSLCKHMVVETVLAGDYLFRRGQRDEWIYVIQFGVSEKVRICSSIPRISSISQISSISRISSKPRIPSISRISWISRFFRFTEFRRRIDVFTILLNTMGTPVFSLVDFLFWLFMKAKSTQFLKLVR